MIKDYAFKVGDSVAFIDKDEYGKSCLTKGKIDQHIAGTSTFRVKSWDGKYLALHRNLLTKINPFGQITCQKNKQKTR